MTEDRKEYISHLTQQLDQWRSKMHEIEERANVAEAEISDEYRTLSSQLSKEMQEAENKIESLKNVKDENWSQAKEKIEDEWKNLNKLFSRVLSAIEIKK